MRIRYAKKENGKLEKKALVYTLDEHRINAADVDGDALFITRRLKAAGFETYIVGGAVRDLILGKRPKDFDIVTEATPVNIKKLFRNSRIIGRRFRLAHVFFGPKIIEVSTFRSLKDGHTSNTFGSVEEDVLRRDFTLNALLYDPENMIVIDYINGMNDIKKKRIRPIIPEDMIFQDDPVRMIRAVKYAAAAGFSIPWLLLRRIKKEAPLLASVSPSRRTEELFKIIRSPHVETIVRNLEETGLYTWIQTEASALLKTPDFKNSYFQSLAKLGTLNETGNVLSGAGLSALIRDYMEKTCDWKELEQGGWEECRAAFFSARRFLLPINPPRAELEKAVRLVFAEHGIDLKKVRLFTERRPHSAGEHPAKPRPAKAKSPSAAEHSGTGTNRNTESPAKHGRRRRGKKPRPEGATGQSPLL